MLISLVFVRNWECAYFVHFDADVLEARFDHPWFQLLADVERAAIDGAGLFENGEAKIIPLITSINNKCEGQRTIGEEASRA